MSNRLRVLDKIENALKQWDTYRVEARENSPEPFVVITFLGSQFGDLVPLDKGMADEQNWTIDCHEKTVEAANVLADAVEFALAKAGFRTYREGEAKAAEGRFAATVAATIIQS